MRERDALMASILGLHTQGLPEWRDRAERELDAYRDQILREATAKIRANTVIPSDVETAHDYAEFLADLIDPDKVSPRAVSGG